MIYSQGKACIFSLSPMVLQPVFGSQCPWF